MGTYFIAPSTGDYKIVAEIELQGERHAVAGAGVLDFMQELIPGRIGTIIDFADPADLLLKAAGARNAAVLRVESIVTRQEISGIAVESVTNDSSDVSFNDIIVVETTVNLNEGDTVSIKAGLETTIRAWGNVSVVVKFLDSKLRLIRVERQ